MLLDPELVLDDVLGSSSTGTASPLTSVLSQWERKTLTLSRVRGVAAEAVTKRQRYKGLVRNLPDRLLGGQFA